MIELARFGNSSIVHLFIGDQRDWQYAWPLLAKAGINKLIQWKNPFDRHPREPVVVVLAPSWEQSNLRLADVQDLETDTRLAMVDWNGSVIVGNNLGPGGWPRAWWKCPPYNARTAHQNVRAARFEGSSNREMDVGTVRELFV